MRVHTYTHRDNCLKAALKAALATNSLTILLDLIRKMFPPWESPLLCIDQSHQVIFTSATTIDNYHLLLRIFPFIFYKRQNIVKYNSTDTDCSANKDGNSIKTTAGEKVVALPDSLKWPFICWSPKYCRQYTKVERSRGLPRDGAGVQKSRTPSPGFQSCLLHSLA